MRDWFDIRFRLDKQMNAMQRNASCQMKSFVYLARSSTAWTISWIIQMSEYPRPETSDSNKEFNYPSLYFNFGIMHCRHYDCFS